MEVEKILLLIKIRKERIVCVQDRLVLDFIYKTDPKTEV